VLLTPAGRPAGRAAGRAMDTVLPCHDPGEPFGDSSACTAMHRRADDRQDTRSGLWPVHACSNGRTRSPRRRPVTSGSHLSEWTRRGSCSAKARTAVMANGPERGPASTPSTVGPNPPVEQGRFGPIVEGMARFGPIVGRVGGRFGPIVGRVGGRFGPIAGDGQVRTDRRGRGQVRTDRRGWAGSDRSLRRRGGRFGPIVGGVVRVSGLVGAVVVPWFEGILR
jgi:hypothetical protein